ncbi:histidine phosphatase family protein [Exiguobacterium acetylicum]|uniref:histidine phosphatase family protein n=1 Tax=Exiguobacterium acetylicum TaxID=41170 RepID=UPI001EE1AD64|nr:histidine phosphatase family protein [Exiguobacterium acetylicum]UKS54668.1 histidine phosphatase family protein [Exiguobacterium acetylicum]
MTTIYFVRHCESVKTGSDQERGLTEAGQLQAQKLVGFFEAMSIDAIYSSPMRRASDSVRPLANQRNIQVITAPFQERLFQRLDERLTSERLEEVVSQSFLDVDYAESGGESNRMALDRAVAAIEKLRDRHPKQQVLVATHGLILSLVLERYTGRAANEWLDAMSSPAIHQLTFDALEKAFHEQLL